MKLFLLLTWGISYWDAEKGRPKGIIEDNIIYSTGACGVSITRSKPGPNPGHIVGNVIVKTAQNPKYDVSDYYCYQCALSISAIPDNFKIEDNLLFNNCRATENLPDYDLSKSEYKKSAEGIRKKLLYSELFRHSDFVKFLSEY